MSGRDPAEVLRIERGLCYIMFAYDAARSLNLEEGREKRIQETSERQNIRRKRRTPDYFDFQTAALARGLWHCPAADRSAAWRGPPSISSFMTSAPWPPATDLPDCRLVRPASEDQRRALRQRLPCARTRGSVLRTLLKVLG